MTAREVELSGGAPWGFRMHGGVDQNQPLRISRQRYSDSLERIIEVNPGRKASLSGIREGDVISSINGRPTRSMSNADAHAMLRNAGPVLRLGLNEDKEMSPRRRSIGRGSTELKRPSQLLAEVQSGTITPQAPVYATIRAPQSPNLTNSSPIKSSNSQVPYPTPGSTNSMKTAPTVSAEEPLRFHPTNPFYSTLPSNNYSSASKLPIPNGKTMFSSMDRSRPISKPNDLSFNNEYSTSSFFTTNDSVMNGSSYENLQNKYENHTNCNGSQNETREQREKIYFNDSSNSKSEHAEFPNRDYNFSTNPNMFKTFTTDHSKNDPFQKYMQNNEDENKKGPSGNFTNSQSDSNFYTKKEEVTKRSTITEHKVDQIEEVKTIKKIILNGSNEESAHRSAPRDVKKDFDPSKWTDAVSSAPPTKVYFSQPPPLTPATPLTPLTLVTPAAAARSPVYTTTGSERQTVMIAPTFKARSTSPAVWRPGAPTPPPAPHASASAAPPPPPAPPLTRHATPPAPPAPPLPVWTPGSAGASPLASRKTFRPVQFAETPPARRKYTGLAVAQENGCTSGSESEGRLRTSQSAPATGFNTLNSPSPTSTRLPRAQNPTVTLLQKAREGHLPRGASYLPEKDSARLPRDRITPPKSDPVHALRREYASEGEAERSDYERAAIRKMADAKRKVDGIGPITKDGMPVALRSEVKDPSKWYKKMYDTIHKNKYDDDYVTIRYKSRRGDPGIQRVTGNKSQYAYFDPRSGYLSEPEGGLSRLGYSTCSDAYDSDATSAPRRRTASVQDGHLASHYLPTNKYSTLASAKASQEVYKNQPGRIENYIPGKSSVVDKEAKQWWDEVMDIFDGWLDENSPLPPYSTLLARAIQKSQLSSTTSLPQASPKEKKDITSAILSKSNMARALKESGYESDSTLVFRRREDTEGPLSPAERRAAYRDLQAGGEPPLRGFRSPAPPRQDETEIEYIPLSPTLTKIRVHKKQKSNEVICYPLQQRLVKSCDTIDDVTIEENPPAPPRRTSSKNSRTLKLVTSTKPSSTTSMPTLETKNLSNIDFLKNKLHKRLIRQNTHTIVRNKKTLSDPKTLSNPSTLKQKRMSTSAPPAINRTNVAISRNPCQNMKKPSVYCKPTGTSSFGSPRRTILPTDYNNPLYSKYEDNVNTRIVIEGGAGRRTPISNILDKVTSLDKLWNSEKRNEPCHLTQRKSYTAKAITKNSSKILANTTNNNNNRGRNMVRTSEKVLQLKASNAKSTPCLATKPKFPNPQVLTNFSNIQKPMSSNMNSKKHQPIKTATVTKLRNKKQIEAINHRGVPCHISCSKKHKEAFKNIKNTKAKNNTHNTTINPENSDFVELKNSSSPDDPNRNNTYLNEIINQRDTIESNSFFQHLFLRNHSVRGLVDHNMVEDNSSVLQKAKMFQSYPQDYNISRSLNSYLVNRKPVSLSKFKIWDSYPSSERLSNPRSISWPGRVHHDVRKFDSLSGVYDEFGSTTSLATIRSKSEPPTNKIFFSQTIRPKSPTVIFHKKNKPMTYLNRDCISPTKITFTETSRPVSPQVPHKVITKSKEQTRSPTRIVFTETSRPVSPLIARHSCPEIESNKQSLPGRQSPTKIIFSQTSRPVSPKICQKKSSTTNLSRSQSSSPVSIRSPSYRRIHNARLYGKSIAAQTNLVPRTRSAEYTETSSHDIKTNFKAHSDNLLYDPDYDEYLNDMENNKIRSQRFRELNRYYSYLERVGELEKATSTSDLRHRKRDEEIIDFDRWKKIRAIERAEEELNNLYNKLKIAQSEKDVLFYPRDINDFRWSHDRERGLKIKEKSVEDLKEHFQQVGDSDVDMSHCSEPLFSKDMYKPLWRGTSVAETAFNINKKNESTEEVNNAFVNKPKITYQEEHSLSDLRQKLGLGNRLWSSLSMEQVNALKNQLNAIYSKDIQVKANVSYKDTDKFSIDVTDDSHQTSKLQVRSNSLICNNKLSLREKCISKSGSIAAINSSPSVKELKNNVNQIQMTLSENEKKRISQTLSKEVLDRIKKFEGDNVERSILAHSQEQKKSLSSFSLESSLGKQVTANQDSVIVSKPEMERKTVFLSDKPEISHQSSASETETASSDMSNKTVIYKGPSKEVQKKVEYFESVKNDTEQSKTIYHAREDSNDLNKNAGVAEPKEIEKKGQQIIKQSQSCTNFKELFGESKKNKFLSLPPKPGRHSRSPSPHSEVYVDDRRTPDTLRYSSNETICRSRSVSPDSEQYWRAYLNLARAGEVRRLARHFDSASTRYTTLRRHRSDPELVRSVVSNNWPSMEKHVDNVKLLKRTLSPVARVPLRPSNRYMPHIDIISKLAALRRRTTPRSRSADEVPECRQGEVERMRRRFETMSLLGHIYTSAPDVSELRDIAPYLAGPWIAHKYPRRHDNNKNIQDGNLIKGQTSPIRKNNKIKSVSKDSVKLSSILKSDAFATQVFDKAAHTPRSRYEPPRAPARPPPAAWPYWLAPYVSSHRHNVKFKETDVAPDPPRRAAGGSMSDTESPRRYVESDVNIHYRCPVRRDPLPLVPERELAQQQADHMRRLYREQRRTKYLQDVNPLDIEAFDESIKELQDMQNRRHQDNFTPAQKAIVPLNRYDDAARTMARALYTFNGQTPRELSFRKGEVIHVRRQVDANWYEGELQGRVGLFPYNYVELLKGDAATTPKKSSTVEGRARAKFEFTAQTNLELPLKKGETVALTRRIDQNWWEGRRGSHTGIFPDTYVTVLQEPAHSKPELGMETRESKPVGSPASHGLVNGTARRSMGTHTYTPQLNSPALSNAPPATQPLPGYLATPAQAQALLTPSERGYGPPAAAADLNNTEPLYVDTNAEAVPYRAMYKYRPQNPDELELREGDTVYVLEKCDDGWYVGSSQRTGRFGTFPGNYVERI